MAAIQEIKLNIIPNGKPPIVYLSQYDKGIRQLIFHLYDGSVRYKIPDGARAEFRGTKTDKTGFDYICTISDNDVIFDVEDQVTVCAGRYLAEIRIIVGDGQLLSSAYVDMWIKPSALADDTVISETELASIEKAAEAYDRSLEVQANVEALEKSAEQSESEAKAQATAAKNSADASASSATAAKSSEDAAKVSEKNAKTSETNAGLSESNAKDSENAAAASATSSADSASASASSATASASSATASKASADESSSYATNAAARAVSAQNSADKAATSEINAKDSENAAAASATNASNSESNASGYATAAKGSADAAANSASDSSLSATNSADSATASANSATASKNSADSSASSATSSKESADAAASSATAAEKSAKDAADVLATAVAGNFSYQVVDDLPTTGAQGIIYLKAKEKTEDQNVYDEYLWINDKFEKIGDTKVDLSDYVKTDDTRLNDASESASGLMSASDKKALDSISTITDSWIDKNIT